MKVLDLFAGAGGWDVAAQGLGFDVAGVENMKEAKATREANGLATLFDDVWTPFGMNESHPWRQDPAYLTRKRMFDWWDERPVMMGERKMLIGSPPCQTFSAAGKGAGRAALDDVLAAIRHYDDVFNDYTFENPLTYSIIRAADSLRQFTAARGMDERTALVITPLLYVDWLLPNYILLEQVPSVLPVWEAYRGELVRRGYSVETRIVNAAAHGVPQTRERAVLLARRDGRAVGEIALSGQRTIADALPGREKWSLRSNYGTSGDKDNRGIREWYEPAFTVTSKANRNKWLYDGIAENVTPEEAAALQTFPSSFTFAGTVNKQVEQIGNAVPPLLAKRLLEAVTS